jgi:hypothetical protein
MKQILTIGMAIVLVMAFAIPAFAIDTDVEIDTSGNAPEVKCAWIAEDTCDDCQTSCGDDCKAFGSQIAANPGEVLCDTGGNAELVIACSTVTFYAIVRDPQGIGDINDVYADVYHPDVQQRANLSGDVLPPEWCGSFKYQQYMPMFNCESVDTGWTLCDIECAIALLEAADADCLVHFNGEYDLAEISEELIEEQAVLYVGCNEVCNHQPCGTYDVDIIANDRFGTWGMAFPIWFEMCCLDSFLVDFDVDGVDYGTVNLDTEQMVGGDADMCTPDMPTVWNNGNTYINMTVMQDDMGLGYTQGMGWNVHYCARLGNAATGTKVCYEPDDKAVLPELLVMCTPTKLDFWITVEKYPYNPDNPENTFEGSMTLGCEHVNFTLCGTCCTEVLPWSCPTVQGCVCPCGGGTA